MARHHNSLAGMNVFQIVAYVQMGLNIATETPAILSSNVLWFLSLTLELHAKNQLSVSTM